MKWRRALSHQFVALIWVVFSILAILETTAQAQWLDQTHGPFFPKSVGSIVSVQAKFPVLWWDVLIIQGKTNQPPNWTELQDECRQFSKHGAELIAKVFCGTDLGEITRQASLFDDWIRDYPLRHRRPSDRQISEQMDQVLAQASLPIGGLVQILRQDPFRSLPELQHVIEGDLKFNLVQHGGFFYDPNTQRVVIPVQFSFPATDTKKTASVTKYLDDFCPSKGECHTAFMIGAHAATFENEFRVKDDLHSVSLISSLLLICILIFVCVSRRWRLLMIAPPIFAAILFAAMATVLVFGSIHGLTLAFGPGIVGLSMDYGLHIAFSNQPRRIWRANLFGLLTTVVVLLIMMLSQIPLLQQLMFFSAIGITLGSLAIYLIFRKFPQAFAAASYGVNVPSHPAYALVIFILVVISILGLATTHLNLDMRQLGYQAPLTAELSEWLYQKQGLQSPLLQVYSESHAGAVLQLAQEQKSWAEEKQIQFSGVAGFLPSLQEQKENLESWNEINFNCKAGTPLTESNWFTKKSASFTPLQHEFFKPYFAHRTCRGVREIQLNANDIVPSYLHDFGSAGEWLTLWHPETEAQALQIKERFPGVLSYSDLAMMFPKIFAQELVWMVPISILSAFFILVYYYRRVSLACLGVLPFFSGFGLCVLCNALFHWNMSFISVIGLIMVFGFSLDFGVFATDLMERQRERPDQGIWTALTVAAVINGCGFMPLMFCQHPVLVHLGRTLFLGTIGTYFGSVWGIPGLYQLLRLEKKT